VVLCFLALACGNGSDASSTAQTPTSAQPGTTDGVTTDGQPSTTAATVLTTTSPTTSAEPPDPATTYALADVTYDYLVPQGSTPTEILADIEGSESSADTAERPQGSLADFAGQPLVINFWASWCPPCVLEMPHFETAHQTFKGEVAFLGMNVEDEPADALGLAIETGVTYPLSSDPQGNIQLDFTIINLPATLFISPEGEELDRWLGVLNEAELTKRIEANFSLPNPSSNP